MSQNTDNPLTFPLPNRVQYLPVFIYSPESFLISNFIKPADQTHTHTNKPTDRLQYTALLSLACSVTSFTAIMTEQTTVAHNEISQY